MIAVLVTGMSATGKSTVLYGLARRGHHVVDTDYDGWTREVRATDGSVDHQRNEGRMTALLTQASDQPLFVAGCVSNQGRFYDRFHAVVRLSAPEKVVRGRVANWTGGAHGAGPGELEQIRDDLRTVEPLLRRGATVEVDTRQPPSEVADVVQASADRRAASSYDRLWQKPLLASTPPGPVHRPLMRRVMAERSVAASGDKEDRCISWSTLSLLGL